MYLSLTVLLLAAAGQKAWAVGTSEPTWPYGPQLFHIDSLLYETQTVGAIPSFCRIKPGDSSTVAAQWVRLAYHDMSTHVIEEGTGGLDASIRFETERPQNIGPGMANSLEDFSISQTAYVSMADLIAMGAIFGYASCGGPTHADIPYRMGRIDATTPGSETVPEPHQDLQTHIDSFKRQGFTQSEMITLVACGHTLGGVSKADFPTIPDTSFGLFHGAQSYDTMIVTGYLNDTTPNPLVASKDESMRSDFRIFSSDGNSTMKRLSDPDVFKKECASLVERMINTVPKGVKLSDPILPIKYKVGFTRLYPGTTALTFTTSLRLLDLSANPNRKVTLRWSDREGSSCPVDGCSAEGTKIGLINDAASGFRFINMKATLYRFEAPVNASSSMSKFWFVIDEGNDTDKLTLDNGGKGYVIDQDVVLFDPVRSKITSSENQVTVAVKTSLINASTFSLRTHNPQTSGPSWIPRWGAPELVLNSALPPTLEYTFFTATGLERLIRSFDVLANGKIVQDFVTTGEILTRI